MYLDLPSLASQPVRRLWCDRRDFSIEGALQAVSRWQKKSLFLNYLIYFYLLFYLEDHIEIDDKMEATKVCGIWLARVLFRHHLHDLSLR
jgi:hypothetical protein